MSEFTEAEAAEMIRNFSSSTQNKHSFMTNVVKAQDTTRIGNLSEDELGMSKLPLRTYKELELFSRDVYEDESWADWFKNMALIQTDTSLSKEAMLLKLAAIEKKELADTTPKRKPNRGMFGFGKKQSSSEGGNE